MRTFKWAVSICALFALATTISFLVQRHLGVLHTTTTLEQLIMRVIAWPLMAFACVFTVVFAVQSARADVRNQKLTVEQKQAQQLAAQEQQKMAEDKAHKEFVIVLTGAQLTTGLFDQTKPLAYYMNPMLEQLKPYGKKPKGVFAPADGSPYVYKDQPTIERKLVRYTEQLADKLIWPFRFPALTGQFLYKDIGKLPINQFITLPKEFEVKESERVAAIEKGLDDPAIPTGLSDKEKAPLDPPAWRWVWRYVGVMNGYLRYPKQEPFNEFHLQFAHAGGYDSIKNAFDFIEAHPPGKNPHPLVWTLSVDAPQFVKTEKDRNANDSGTLLMWSHPKADTGRKPLVFLRRPVTIKNENGAVLKQAQVQEAIATALATADVNSVDDIGYLVTDFGIGKPGDDYVGPIGNALAQLSKESDHGIQLIQNRTDLTASIGDIGANTAGFSALCAAWAAFSQNKPSLLVGRPSPDRIDVLVFKPRDNHVPPPHDKLYYGAVAEPEFSRPWWGERLDGKPDFGDEPNKERADGGGLLKPAKPFEFTWQ